MIVRKTLKQANSEGGYIDREKFESFTDADIERMIDEDPDLAPRTETLMPLLEARDVRKKLGLTQQKFAKKLGVPLAIVRVWERDETPVDPVLQALLRILDRIPESTTLVIHNLVVGGHRTSVRLEPVMWDALHDIARRLRVTTHDLVTEIDRERTESSLTSAIRVYIVDFYHTAVSPGGRRQARAVQSARLPS
jgi:predicted DNA-binding ribbon-helix-helix protein